MNSVSHTGAAGELIACSYFLSQGLEVFRNVAAAGPADLFVFNKDTGKAIPVDIKSHTLVSYRLDGALSPSYTPKWRSGIAVVKYIHGERSVSVPDGFWEALGMETAE